jgi:16S rRNA (adenine1518-N6/adenine1519-N6)-dimethyltransferase
LRPEELREKLHDIGIRPSKSRGQCFLVDEDVAMRQIALADIEKDETVLEIGPGLGVLTRPLSKKAKKVVAIEQDKRLYENLRTMNMGNVELINADALKVDFPDFDRVVSNLPFQISSPITFKFLEHGFRNALLMYQREFAERLVEERGRNSSRLSVKLYYRADAKTLDIVPRNAFYPVPDVDSAIVRLSPKSPPFKVENEALFFRVVDCIYGHRRKKIQNCFRENWRWFVHDRERMKAVLKELPFKDKRAEELSPEDMGELSNCLSRLISSQ